MRCRLFGASILAMTVAHASAWAQTRPGGIEDVVVTAQKRSEKLQKVPQSIQALDGKKLQQLNATEFLDYVKFLPSVSFQTTGPNQTEINMRGVSSGGDGNHSGPLPTVGTYLDEMPTTTVNGVLDVHLYDIARVESLPGPQGTLYGASSEAGTLRIITNKPSTDRLFGGYDVTGTYNAHGGPGGTAEGFINIPLTSNAAIRLVGFDERDAGFIDNVAGTRTFATSGFTINNQAFQHSHFNPSNAFGGRAELLWDINDNWSILAEVLGQDQREAGIFGYQPDVGYLKTQQFNTNSYHDRWAQAGLTVTGKIADYELTYAGSLFVRDVKSYADYTDYSIYYDAYYGSGANWRGNNGKPLNNPQQSIFGQDHFNKESNEIRLASPTDQRLRFIVGAFQEVQTHRIEQDYNIQGFADALTIPGWPNTIWLTDQLRTDSDVAAFTEAYLDVTPQFTLTAGVRPYYYDNSLKGFFGFSQGYDQLTGYHSGEGANGQYCKPGQSYLDAPCVDLNKTVTGSGETHKVNLTYRIDDDRLVYFTYSTGYRPGGVNRNANFGGYNADTLVNYELGFKSSWFDHTFTFNTALYDEEWSQFQFPFLGPNSLTIIENAPAAQIYGMEGEFDWRAMPRLDFSGGYTLTDAELSQNFCGTNQATGQLQTSCTKSAAQAPSGTQLPYTPVFKGNLTSRYSFDLGDWTAHVQGSVIYQTRNYVALRTADNQALGSIPSYATFDFSAGMQKNKLSLEFFVKNAFDTHGEINRVIPCTYSTCGITLPGVPHALYIYPVTPMIVGLRLSQRF